MPQRPTFIAFCGWRLLSSHAGLYQYIKTEKKQQTPQKFTLRTKKGRRSDLFVQKEKLLT